MFKTNYEKFFSGLTLDTSPITLPADEVRQELVNNMFLDDRTTFSVASAWRHITIRILLWTGLAVVCLFHALDTFARLDINEFFVLAPVCLISIAVYDRSPILSKFSWAVEKRLPIKVIGVGVGCWLLAIIESDALPFIQSILKWLPLAMVLPCGDGLLRASLNLEGFRKAYAIDRYIRDMPQSGKEDVLRKLDRSPISSTLWQNVTKKK